MCTREVRPAFGAAGRPFPTVPRRSSGAEGKQDALQVHGGRRILMTAKSPAPRNDFHLQGRETESSADG